jgi:N-acetyl-anhydromuramyl-L-alanine amidase AmpD
LSDVKSPCSGKYAAVHTSGVRKPSDIKWIVLHSTEGDTAEGAASWFTNPKSSGSANLVVDDKECFRTVADLRVPWAAPPLNEAGFHIEFAGYAKWTHTDWMIHKDMLHRAAYKAALRAKLYKIPVRQVGPIGLRLGRKGFTSHNAVSLAWRKSDHKDPGPGFPWDYFLNLVDGYLAETL